MAASCCFVVAITAPSMKSRSPNSHATSTPGAKSVLLPSASKSEAMEPSVSPDKGRSRRQLLASGNPERFCEEIPARRARRCRKSRQCRAAPREQSAELIDLVADAQRLRNQSAGESERSGKSVNDFFNDRDGGLVVHPPRKKEFRIRDSPGGKNLRSSHKFRGPVRGSASEC